MKFLDQVKLYQSALAQKSRFYSLLMLASGLGLVGAAPFLSYEVSKIECYEKGTVPPKISDKEMLILKDEWQEKNQEIIELKNSVKIKDVRIKKIINETNCEDVIKERDKWEVRFNECEKALKEGGPAEDCSRFERELVQCNQKLTRNAEVISGLRIDLEKCKKKSGVNISGTFHHKETFTFNNEKFIVNINSDDVGANFDLLHDGKNVTREFKYVNKSPTYSFKDAKGNTSYRITFGRKIKNSVQFTLTTT